MNARIEKIIRLGAVVSLLLSTSCTDDDRVPKPIGYFRIDIPQDSYTAKDSIPCPFEFEVSSLSRLELFPDSQHPCWFNLSYPSLSAKVHFTYRAIDGDLRELLEESRGLAYEHGIMANSIDSRMVLNRESKVYGLTYDLGGKVASPYQFYLTDSVNHFIRGSLYFNSRPNPDSIAPALAFVTRDIDHLISTFRWK